MKWINLKQNKCPNCGKQFGFVDFNAKPGYIVCRCGFAIREKRYSEIVNSQVTAGLPSIDDDGDQTTPEDYL